MTIIKRFLFFVVLAWIGTPVFGFDLPLENARYISPAEAREEIYSGSGIWRLVEARDTQFPEFSDIFSIDEPLLVEFRNDGTGIDRTAESDRGGRALDFNWDVVERNNELWIEMIVPEYENFKFEFKLIFFQNKIAFFYVDIERYDDNPNPDFVIYERM